MTPRAWFLLSLSLCLVVLSGCNLGPTRGKVHGKITYKGQPLSAGSVTFHAPEGGIFSYPLSADGTYAGSDLPPGEYAVTVETESANPNRSKPSYDRQGKAGADPNDYAKQMKERGQVPEDSGPKGSYVKIPAKYAEKTKSGLKETLTGGQNEKSFDLTD